MEREIAVEPQLTSLETQWKVTPHLEKYKDTMSFKVKGIEGHRKKNNYSLNLHRIQLSSLILQVLLPLNRKLEDFKPDRDPTVNPKAAINDLEQRRIDLELLKIKVRIVKDPADYAVNNPNKKIGICYLEQKLAMSYGITRQTEDKMK